MPDYPLYPESTGIEYPVDTAEVITAIAAEARQAFFATVAERLNDLYPGSKTWGDEYPGESVDRDRIAIRWVESFAWNNTAVQEYNQQPCKFGTTEVYVTDQLMNDWPEGITGVQIDREPESFPGLRATVRGTRAAIYDYILDKWDGTDDLDEWADLIVADTEVTS